MPDNRQVNRNGGISNSSIPSVDYIEEAIRRLKIQSNDKQDGDAMAQSSLYLDRPGEPDCIYYLRTGTCGYGNNCRFNHPSIGQGGWENDETVEEAAEREALEEAGVRGDLMWP